MAARDYFREMRDQILETLPLWESGWARRSSAPYDEARAVICKCENGDFQPGIEVKAPWFGTMSRAQFEWGEVVKSESAAMWPAKSGLARHIGSAEAAEKAFKEGKYRRPFAPKRSRHPDR